MIPEDFATACAAAGLTTQAGIARALGVNVSTVWRWQHGKSRIPPVMGLAVRFISHMREQPRRHDHAHPL